MKKDKCYYNTKIEKDFISKIPTISLDICSNRITNVVFLSKNKMIKYVYHLDKSNIKKYDEYKFVNRLMLHDRLEPHTADVVKFLDVEYWENGNCLKITRKDIKEMSIISEKYPGLNLQGLTEVCK